jgi:insulysin
MGRCISHALGRVCLQSLVKFHTTYYSADIMKMAVVGREPLETLQSWVLDMFSTVRNTNQPSHYTYPVPPYTPDKYGIRLSVVPVKDLRRVTLAFPLPYDWQKQRCVRAMAMILILSLSCGVRMTCDRAPTTG